MSYLIISMKKPPFVILLLLLGIAFVPAMSAGELVRIAGHEASADRVIARLNPEPTKPTKTPLSLSQLGVRIVKQFSIVEGLVVLEFDNIPQPNAVVPTEPDPDLEGRRLQNRITRLMRSGLFSYVEPNYIYHSTLQPSDTAYQNGTLWGLDNIAAPAAWDVTTGSTAVTVAVIDSGVNYLHQDLAGQMWTNPGEIPNNGLDDDNDGYVDNVFGINAITNDGDPMDDNQHGSHVAGTIGASANDAGPIVGVAWNIRIMACKFLDASGSGGLDDAIECIEFAQLNGAHIMNNSWGGGPYVQSLFDAIQATRDAGRLFVAAAGNESNNNDSNAAYPASYNVDNVISVAAIDINNGIANFSNYGSQSVHLGAPGVNIYSSIHTTPTAYASLNGTSMASPHVAGAAALLWSQFQPANVAEMLELRQRLLAGAVATPSLAGKTSTGGRLNIANSLTLSPDGNMEIAVFSESGQTVLADRPASFFVQASDLFPVTSATVTGSASFGGGAIAFLNDGIAPDLVAGDNIYSVSMDIPAEITSFTLEVDVSAPPKEPANQSVVFTVVPAPSNDFFVGREPITSIPATLTTSSRNATAEPGEGIHVYEPADYPGELPTPKSLWWTWTAPTDGVYSLSTDGSDFDTLLAVYRGNNVATLDLAGRNDDAGFDWTSTVVFPASSGTAYQFVVDGYYSLVDPFDPFSPTVTDFGGVQLNFKMNDPMINDNFADRTPFTGLNVAVTGHNVGSSWEPLEPEHFCYDPPLCYEPFATVWWSWTAPSTGPVTFSTAGSSFDTILAVYTGSSLGGLSQIASNDDADDIGWLTLASEVNFFAQAGQSYQIAVDTAAGVGNVELHVANAPPNDSFNNSISLTGDLVEAEGYTLNATFEAGEPSPVGNVFGRSIWWNWTAPRTGKVTLTTDGSNFDTTLVVYTGNSVSSLTSVVENNDRVDVKIRTSLVSFGATEGATYQIQLDGYEGLAGRARLTLMMDGRSELSELVLRPDGSATVDLLGEPNRIYVLESSGDLVNWSGTDTNTVVSRHLRFTDPTQDASDRFYRARPASLITEE